MLLTLSVKSLDPLIGSDDSALDLMGVPEFVAREFELQGLSLHTDALSGWSLERIDRLRDQGDKQGCPWLTMIEPAPHPLGAEGDDPAELSLDRLMRVLRVAHRLGCAAVAVSIDHPAGDSDLTDLSERLKTLVGRAEALELNLLVAPSAGLTAEPESLTGLIRKVGGFRIGSFPDFEPAAASGDPANYLRQLAPYASVVRAAATGFNKSGEHTAFDFAGCLDGLWAVGYEGSLAIEYRGSGDPVAGVQRAKELIVASAETES